MKNIAQGLTSLRVEKYYIYDKKQGRGVLKCINTFTLTSRINIEQHIKWSARACSTAFVVGGAVELPHAFC